MKLRKEGLTIAAALVMALGLAGCGGGGSSMGSASSNSTMNVYAADDMSTGFDNVWVTIDTVSLTKKDGTSVTVFDQSSSGGQPVDLMSLHNGNGSVFLLLGQAPPAGSYTSVSVVLSSSLSVVPTGSNSAVQATFAGAAGNNFTMNLALPISSSSNGVQSSTDAVVDFDLKDWTLNGNTVSAANNQFLKNGPTTGMGSIGQHSPGEYAGQIQTVAGTAPTQELALSQGPSTLNVQLSADTVVVNADGSEDPVLSSGEFALVSGTFNPQANAVEATMVELFPLGTSNTPQVGGLVEADDANAQTITIQVGTAFNWMPGQKTLTIDIGPSTALLDPSGVSVTPAEFYAQLTAGSSRVSAQGPISAGVMQATTVSLLPGQGQTVSLEIGIVGVPSNVDDAAGTFTITAPVHHEGVLDPNMQTFTVVTNGTTKFSTGTDLASFMASLAPNSSVAVKGIINEATNTITATEVKAMNQIGTGATAL
jgi:hypothetical protein